LARKLLLYAMIAIASYVAGVFCYIGALRFVYGQTMGSDIALIWVWIGLPFFLFVVPLYAAIMTVLRAIRRSSFLLQTVLFLIPGYFAMGAAYFPYGLSLLANPISQEASLFYCCYAATAVVFSSGSRYAEKR